MPWRRHSYDENGRVVAGEWAVEWGRVHGRLRLGAAAADAPVNSKYLLVYKRQTDGAWKIAHDMYNDGASHSIGTTQSIAQVALVVRDYDEAIRFYADKLGFMLIEDTYQPEGVMKRSSHSSAATTRRRSRRTRARAFGSSGGPGGRRAWATVISTRSSSKEC